MLPARARAAEDRAPSGGSARGVHHVQMHTAAERPGVLGGCEVRRHVTASPGSARIEFPAEGFRVDKRRAEQPANGCRAAPFGRFVPSRRQVPGYNAVSFCSIARLGMTHAAPAGKLTRGSPSQRTMSSAADVLLRIHHAGKLAARSCRSGGIVMARQSSPCPSRDDPRRRPSGSGRSAQQALAVFRAVEQQI